VVEDHLAGQDLPGVAQQQLEQQELRAGQLDQAAVAADLVGAGVKFEVGVLEDRRVRRPAGAAQQSAQARE